MLFASPLHAVTNVSLGTYLLFRRYTPLFWVFIVYLILYFIMFVTLVLMFTISALLSSDTSKS